jgi:hypothetical protein
MEIRVSARDRRVARVSGVALEFCDLGAKRRPVIVSREMNGNRELRVAGTKRLQPESVVNTRSLRTVPASEPIEVGIKISKPPRCGAA